MKNSSENKANISKADYIVRVLTVAPLLAAITLTVLFIQTPSYFSSALNFVFVLLFLGILPLFAYPLQKYIPHFKDLGRKGQRTLAMIFAVCGYMLSSVWLLIFGSTREEWLIVLTYLLSGVLILILNKGFKLLASGHGCGVAGPIMLLLLLRSYIAAAIGGILMILVFISSIRSKRHTPWQFLGGMLTSSVTAVILALIFNII